MSGNERGTREKWLPATTLSAVLQLSPLACQCMYEPFVTVMSDSVRDSRDSGAPAAGKR